MHALHLPPRHLWRSAALAALLALMFTALLLATAAQLGSDSSPQLSTPQTQLSAPQAPSLTQPSQPNVSSWFEPLATPAPLVGAAQADQV